MSGWILTVALATLGAAEPALANDGADCGFGGDSIGSCTRIIESGRANGKLLSQTDLAVAYDVRGQVYLEFEGEYDLALADICQSLISKYNGLVIEYVAAMNSWLNDPHDLNYLCSGQAKAESERIKGFTQQLLETLAQEDSNSCMTTGGESRDLLERKFSEIDKMTDEALSEFLLQCKGPRDKSQ